MFKKILSVMLLSAVAFAYGPVLKTGQTKSYDAAGNIVTDGSVKDDGFYQVGKARSYSRSATGVVTDNTTGLEWQDDVDSVSKPWVTQENYDAGNYDDTSGDTAATYCSELALDGGGWRLPSIEELETLVDSAQSDPAVTDGVFQHISSDNFWSSTTYAYDTSGAWDMYFYSGSAASADFKTRSNYVRCVRGGQLKPSNFSRSGDIVTDVTTGLQWQDNETAKTTTGTWQEAIDYCENTLNLGGHTDWRLPSKNELLSIVDRSRYDPAINSSIFVNTALSYYWSSTTSAGYSDHAWFVGFEVGSTYYDYNINKTSSYYVRCVRGGQVKVPTISPILSSITLPYNEAVKPETFNLYIKEIIDFDPALLSVSIDGTDANIIEIKTADGDTGIKLPFEGDVTQAGEHTVTISYDGSEAQIGINTSLEADKPFRTVKQNGGLRVGRGLASNDRLLDIKVLDYSLLSNKTYYTFENAPSGFDIDLGAGAEGGVSMKAAMELQSYSDQSAALLVGSSTGIDLGVSAKTGLEFKLGSNDEEVGLDFFKLKVAAKGFGSFDSYNGRFYSPGDDSAIALSIIPSILSTIAPTGLSAMLIDTVNDDAYYKKFYHWGYDISGAITGLDLEVKPEFYGLKSDILSLSIQVLNVNALLRVEYFQGEEGNDPIDLMRVQTQTEFFPLAGNISIFKDDSIFDEKVNSAPGTYANIFEVGQEHGSNIFRTIADLPNGIYYADYPFGVPFTQIVDEYHISQGDLMNLTGVHFSLDIINDYDFGQPVLIKSWIRSDHEMKDFGLEVQIWENTYEMAFLYISYEDALSGVSYRVGNKRYIIYANKLALATQSLIGPTPSYVDYPSDIMKTALSNKTSELVDYLTKKIAGALKAVTETVEDGWKVAKDGGSTIYKAWVNAPTNIRFLWNHYANNTQDASSRSMLYTTSDEPQQVALNNANLTFHSDILELDMSEGDAGGEIIMYATYDSLNSDTGVYRYDFDAGEWKEVASQDEDGGLKFMATQGGYYALIDHFAVGRELFANNLYSVVKDEQKDVISEPIYLSDGSRAINQEFNLTVTQGYTMIDGQIKMGIKPFSAPATVTSNEHGQVTIPIEAGANPGRATVILSSYRGYAQDLFDMVVIEYGTDAPIEDFNIDLNISGESKLGDTITVQANIDKTHDVVTIKIVSPSGEVFAEDTVLLDMAGTWLVGIETTDENGYMHQKTFKIEVPADPEKYPCGYKGRFIQGTTTCVEADPLPLQTDWLPGCAAGKSLIQGTATCEDATPAEDPGLFLPVCPEGERLFQGTNQCI